MKTTAERFWEKVNKKGENDCWNWILCVEATRYPKFKYNDRLLSVHRVALLLSGVNIPPHLHVLHSCDNTKCCNPKHLWLGTHRDNMQDMMIKNRGLAPGHKGEKNNFAKLTETQTLEILNLLKSKTQTEVAAIYNVSQPTVSAIATGRSWKHISR